MKFKRHKELEGKHALLAASRYHWINYTDERLFEYVDDVHAAVRGTKYHELAKRCVELGQKLPNTSQTVNLYVNDVIGYRMEPEVSLFYSEYAFGTADAISFRKEEVQYEGDLEPHFEQILRIFDLKTGKNEASAVQLVVYAALFCLEYNIRPFDIVLDLRIYQNDAVVPIEVDAEEVLHVMGRIKELSKLLAERLEEV